MRCVCGCEEIEFDSTRGDAVCTACGSVLEENAIVSEVQFSESATGSSSVVGQFVSSTGIKPAARGPGGHLQRQSREITIENGRKKLSQIAAALRLNQHHIEASQRLYMLAVQRNFTLGRKVQHVCAACLYIVCRREKTPHLLLDFSDVLQTNVYVLGSCFLKFCRLLNVTLPVIDPSLYIHRFASKLNFADKTHAVAMSALRLVGRMARDWIHTGRRPSGICGAALLVAARMHGFERDVADIVNIVRIADLTIKKRLSELEITPSSGLTVDEFETVDLETECDPPAFTKGRSAAGPEEASEDGPKPPPKSRKRRVHESADVIAAKGRTAGAAARSEEADEDGEDGEEEGEGEEGEGEVALAGRGRELALRGGGGGGGGAGKESGEDRALALAAAAGGPLRAHDDALGIAAMPEEEFHALERQVQSAMETEEFRLLERDTARQTDEPIGGPQRLLLTGARGSSSPSPPASSASASGPVAGPSSSSSAAGAGAGAGAGELASVEEAGEGDGGDEELADADDEEVEGCLLAPAEVESRRVIWEALNQSYLEELAERRKKQEASGATARRTHRRKKEGADDAHRAAESPYEACVKALKKQKMSSKINYGALESLFGKKPGE
eukprot:tig00020554_g10818.t1